MAKARQRASTSSPAMATSADIEPFSDEPTNDDNGKRHRTVRWQASQRTTRRTSRASRLLRRMLRVATSTRLAVASLVLILASLMLTNREELRSRILMVGMGYLFVGRPLLSTLAVSCDAHLTMTISGRIHENGTEKDTSSNGGTIRADVARTGATSESGWHARIIAASFFISIVCNQFPKAFSAFVAAGTVFAFGLASRQLVTQDDNAPDSQHDSMQKSASSSSSSDRPATEYDEVHFLRKLWSGATIKERAAMGTLATTASLILENFLIWVVSATYQPGIDGTPDPLQDNGRILLESLAMKLLNVGEPSLAKRPLQSLRDALNVQWALVSALGASFVCLELRSGRTHTRTLAGLALRALVTIACARLVRTVAFVLTVLPSQVPDCYRRHFPVPPPNEWKEWLGVGFSPNSRGGCNDLILSGHATVTSALGCAVTSVASNDSFSTAVWTLMAVDYAIECYQGLHYSVDMWLGCIVTCLLWQLTKPLEVEGERERSQNEIRRNERRGAQAPMDAKVVASYALPAFLGFAVLTLVPESIANYFLLGFAFWAGGILWKWGFTNYVQHILLCLLYATLGVYL